MAKVEITNQLLREAIADAEAVRQTAIENAKLSLEETFTPQIKSMLERKLRAEAEGMGETEMEEATEVPHEEAEAEGSSEMPADSSEIGAGENKEPSDDAFASAEDDMSGEGHTDSSTDWYDDWSESDFDLKEVIEELEEDVLKLEGTYKEEEEEGEEEEKEDEEDKEEGDAEGEEDEEEGEYPEGEPAGHGKGKLHSSDIGTPGKATFTLEEFLGMLEEAGYDVSEMGFGAVHPAAEPPMEEVEESDLNLEEILAMMEAEDANLQEEETSEQMASEVKKLQEEIAEYRTAVQFLRGKLTEVNLLNAKLLYTNKIFRKEGLSDEQKISIVENFDRATTVREVKMVYTVLAESLVPQRTVKVTKPVKKVVAEGLASKVTPSTAPKTETTEILSENSVAKRLQQLAGIIS